jgi:hypothetical protein
MLDGGTGDYLDNNTKHYQVSVTPETPTEKLGPVEEKLKRIFEEAASFLSPTLTPMLAKSAICSTPRSWRGI